MIASHSKIFRIVSISSLLVACTSGWFPSCETAIIEIRSNTNNRKNLYRSWICSLRKFRLEDGNVQRFFACFKRVGRTWSVSVGSFRFSQHIGIHPSNRLCLFNRLTESHGSKIYFHSTCIGFIVRRRDKVPDCLKVWSKISFWIFRIANIDARIILGNNHTQISTGIFCWIKSLVLSRQSYLVGSISLCLEGVLVILLSFFSVVNIDSIPSIHKHVANLILHTTLQYIVGNVIRTFSCTVLDVHFVSQCRTDAGTCFPIVCSQKEAVRSFVVQIALFIHRHWSHSRSCRLCPLSKWRNAHQQRCHK